MISQFCQIVTEQHQLRTFPIWKNAQLSTFMKSTLWHNILPSDEHNYPTWTLSSISVFSSVANKLGTSPVFKTIDKSSKNDSSLICSSVKRKTTFLLSAPDIFKTFNNNFDLEDLFNVNTLGGCRISFRSNSVLKFEIYLISLTELV